MVASRLRCWDRRSSHHHWHPLFLAGQTWPTERPLELRLGSQAVANQPALALIDTNSYWVDGFFRETTIAEIRSGDKAVVTLMTYPDQPLEGTVDSLGWGISQQDGSTGFELLPQVSPTFEWIRLAQRVPVYHWIIAVM